MLFERTEKTELLHTTTITIIERRTLEDSLAVEKGSTLAARSIMTKNRKSMTISETQKRWLKKQVHHLKPIVTVGQAGLTEPVLAEIELALNHHELLKVKVNAGDREQRDAQIAEIAQQTRSDLINRIGNTASFYRSNPEKKTPMALPTD